MSTNANVPETSSTNAKLKLDQICSVLTVQEQSDFDELISDPHGRKKVVEHKDWHIDMAGEHFNAFDEHGDAGGWLGDPAINMYMALLQV